GDQRRRDQRDHDPRRLVPDPGSVEERVAEQADFGSRRGRERRVRAHQRPTGEEADVRPERRPVQRVRGSRVIEVARQSYERVRHEADRDRGEQEGQWNGPADVSRGRDAVQRHRRRRRHDPDGKRDRFPEPELATKSVVRGFLSDRTRGRCHYLSPFSKMSSGTNKPTTQFGASTTSWMRRSAATEHKAYASSRSSP